MLTLKTKIGVDMPLTGRVGQSNWELGRELRGRQIGGCLPYLCRLQLYRTLQVNGAVCEIGFKSHLCGHRGTLYGDHGIVDVSVFQIDLQGALHHLTAELDLGRHDIQHAFRVI